ncbi:MAG: hypothetical protein HON53_11740 [Planctomycetaceae bacterium]|jgi:type 1 glutamine amidotransferase|nr:hypothetical protein [Planctomycetaceae bacterium]MBT6157475.1 hypothetical protein [Planctomycetaceae bacterium]MBT6488088.1 hypothetical protein [Planctomycetaceae bacterium]MBT6495283.1 hypothetical protein [Planctomycetaceae bacterium]
MFTRLVVVSTLAIVFAAGNLTAAAEAPTKKAKSKPTQREQVKRVLLIGQGPDGHPWGTHEYLAGMRILAQCLQPVKNIQTIVVQADGDWKEGPELIDGADAVVLFVSEGARWIHDDPRRLAALKKLAARGGGFTCWHWGMGCRDAKYIPEYLKLFGGCHGGPDRKYKVVKNAEARVVGGKHPVMRGLEDFTVDEEFYYTLKFAKPANSVTPLIRVKVDGADHSVCWAWERPGGGRSFGYSGGHFHQNWSREDYRRLMTQAVLWTVDVPVPDAGLPLRISPKDLNTPRPKTAESK